MNKYLLTAALGFAWVAAGCESGNIDETYRFTDPIDHVELLVDSSDVTVTPAHGDAGLVTVDVRYWGGYPDLDVWMDGSTLNVDLDCRLGCSGKITVSVPAAAAIDAGIDSGSFQANGIRGDISASADSGNIAVHGAEGTLDLRADSGNITGRDLDSRICDASADSGNITLGFAQTPADVDLEADSGNVRLTVPKGSYDINISADSGNASTYGVTDDPNAVNTLTAHADSGNVTIEGF